VGTYADLNVANWRARCLAAEAERDALRDALARLSEVFEHPIEVANAERLPTRAEQLDWEQELEAARDAIRIRGTGTGEP
jgi:hypothetical protein